MQVEMSRSNTAYNRIGLSRCAATLGSPRGWIGGAEGRESYALADGSFAKFTVHARPMLAQVGPATALSYQEVTRRLKAIGSVAPGPMAQALRRGLIERLVKKGAPVVPHLVGALGHSDKDIRMRAVDVLEQIFSGTASAQTWKGVLCRMVIIPRLAALVKDRDVQMRTAAQRALQSVRRFIPDVKL